MVPEPVGQSELTTLSTAPTMTIEYVLKVEED